MKTEKDPADNINLERTDHGYMVTMTYGRSATQRRHCETLKEIQALIKDGISNVWTPTQ